MKNRSKKSELAIGVVLSYISTCVSLLSTLLLTPIIIRLLGKSDYGLYETIGSFVNYLAIFDLGFSSVVTRYTAKYEAENDINGRDQFLYTCRNIYRVLCLIIFILGILIYLNLDILFSNSFTDSEMYKARIMFLIVLATTIVSIYSQVYKGALNGVEKFVFPRVLTVIKTIMTKIVCILVLYMGADSVGYTMVLLVFEYVLFIMVKIFAKRYISFEKNKTSADRVKELFNFTFFIFIQAIVSQIFWQVDKLLLGMLVGTASVAIYAVALNINNIIRNVSSALRDVILPKATHIAIKDGKNADITEFMTKCGRLILIIYGIMLVGFTVIGKKFILLWLGEGYEEAYIVMLVLSWGAFVPTIQSPGEEVCRAYNKHRFLSVVYFIIAIINVIFTIVLIPRWGLLGAAIPTIVSMIIGNVIIANLYYRKHFGLNILELYINTFNKLIIVLILSILLGGGINMLLPQYNWGVFLLEVLLICLAYFALLVAFGFNNDERQMMKRIAKKLKLPIERRM